ncbi:WD repeat-containing protein 74-like isoform X1 [Watersipora subatra]|uniref:WD repeat-containing protein 74-like isoform X1 n=1 Tax=Watersipora subatra TaxID=2589382 RepID=UPI00355B30B6
MDECYHVFVGAETGLLKGVNVNKNKWENLLDLSTVDRSNEICVMCWENQRLEDSILFGTRGGLVRKYNRHKQSVEDILQVTDNDEVIKGLYKLDSKYVTCTNKGKLCIWQDNLNNEAVDEPVIIDCGENISCMREDPANNYCVSTGGKENGLKIFDLNRPEVGAIFKAKNVRDDWLDLRVPVWVTAIGHLPRPSLSLVLATTGYHQIRVYDPLANRRRPLIDMEWGEQPITSLCVNPRNDRQVMVGNTIGEQGLMDLRSMKCLGKYKGGAGAIRSIQCHPTLPVVVSCGLDRYVRVHDMQSRLLTQKFYMKSRLNKLLLVHDWEDPKPEETLVKEEVELTIEGTEKLPGDTEDALWESLDVVGEPERGHKRKKRIEEIPREHIIKKSKGRRK